MSTPIRSNTIDFDAAKLQRMGYAAQRHDPLLPISLIELHRELAMQLQTSLEPERILALFLGQAKRLVALDALVYQHEPQALQIELGEHASHTAGYHLSHEGDYLGELIFQRQQRFASAELAQLESLLASLLFPLRNALLYRSAVQSAMRDALTGIGNRVAMEHALVREVEVARRHAQPLSLLILDIDFFKQINDQHGHPAGDAVLRLMVDTLRQTLRNIDMVFRYGGEEFVVLLSNTPREAAAMAGERLRMAVMGAAYRVHQDRTLYLTVSLGGATLLPGESTESLLRRADNALYVAKRGGRNRLYLAG